MMSVIDQIMPWIASAVLFYMMGYAVAITLRSKKAVKSIEQLCTRPGEVLKVRNFPEKLLRKIHIRRCPHWMVQVKDVADNGLIEVLRNLASRVEIDKHDLNQKEVCTIVEGPWSVTTNKRGNNVTIINIKTPPGFKFKYKRTKENFELTFEDFLNMTFKE